MSKRYFLLAVTGALALMLAGCQSSLTGTTPTRSASAERLQATLARVERLQSSGRIGSIAGDNRQSLGFTYSFDAGEEKLELISPIGSSVANIRITPGKVVIRENGRVHVASDLGSALDELYGFHLPVSSLRGIMIGRALGDSAYDDQGLLVRTRAGDYTASFGNYREYEGIALPTTIDISTDGVEVKIRQSEIRELGVRP